jgi:hypothetical protein
MQKGFQGFRRRSLEMFFSFARFAQQEVLGEGADVFRAAA